ncbi:hypothetical protein GQ53DRAFT_726104 [Thozetella sp. PMI_491]|nr:hypothetical protein GQ53DRAFT_726104 [Thozetella sp. PMI_491]
MWEVKFVDPFSDDFTVRKIVDLPEVGMLNGLATVPRLPARSCDKAATWILAADCLNGQIVRLETTTGAHETVLDIPQLHASPDGAFPVGVNGLKIHGGYLYWTNTEKVTFFRIRIDEDGYPLEDAQAETIITIPSLHALDDFIFDPEGNIWGVGSTENQVFVIHRDRSTPDGYGSLQFVAGALDSLAIPGPTSCIFGKGDDSKTLYILTSGGIVMPINGTLTQPAKVAAVDTSSFYHR